MSTNTWSFGRSVFLAGMALAAAILVNQVVGCMSAPAQQQDGVSSVVSTGGTGIPATADELIRQMSLSAAVIFAGEVLEVRRPAGFAGSPEDAAEGIVEVDFRVDQAVRGVQLNSIYTLREWSGLWIRATDRYRAGQRLLMMLRAPNAAGLTSPVHGYEGAMPIRGAGHAPGPDDFASSPAQWMVDLRWLQAQIWEQQLRVPSPLRRPSPGRRGGRLYSEALVRDPEVDENAHLVRAIPGPWIRQDNRMPQVESLSHVLGLCNGQAEPQNARH